MGLKPGIKPGMNQRLSSKLRVLVICLESLGPLSITSSQSSAQGFSPIRVELGNRSYLSRLARHFDCKIYLTIRKLILPADMPSANPPSMASIPSKPFSLSFNSSKPKAAPTVSPKKRPHSALVDISGSEDEGNGPQLVTAFDQSAGGAITHFNGKVQAPLVIQVAKNRDWRQESRKKRRKNVLLAEVQAARTGRIDPSNATQVERDEVSKVSGLEFLKRDEEGDTSMSEGRAPHEHPERAAQTTRTADDEAMEALLGDEKKSTLQISATQTDRRNGSAPQPAYDDYENEDDRFKADVASRPDVASLEDYAAVPVEEFGAAMLRGMGWKAGEAIGKRRAGVAAMSKPRNPERRPALLGIGAKEVPGGVGDEFGAWGKVAKGKRKTDLAYIPVVLKNSVTGEMLTEEELEAKKSEAVRKAKGKANEEDDWRERRDRNLRANAETRYERTERKDGRNEDSRSKRSEPMEGRKSHRSLENGYDFKQRERSRSSERSRHSFSRGHPRARDRERSYHHSSSRRQRSGSDERRQRRC